MKRETRADGGEAGDDNAFSSRAVSGLKIPSQNFRKRSVSIRHFSLKVIREEKSERERKK